MSNWEKKIPGVIGDGNKNFGEHPCDAKAAREMFEDAVAEEEGFDRYCKKIEDEYRKTLPNTPDAVKKIQEQMDRVKDLSSYFDHD